MKKVLILCLVLFLLAITIKPIDITGFFVKASSTIVTIARTVIKEVLSVVIKVL